MRAAMRARAMASLAALLAPGGRLLVICRGREPEEPLGELPWPLARADLAAFGGLGLAEASFDDVVTEDVRRFVIEYRTGG